MALRILHVAPYAPDAWAYGGIPRVLGALTRAQLRLGHDVALCATDACDAASRLRPTGTGGLTHHIFPNLSNHAAYRWQAFAPVGLDAFLHRHAHEFDVAHLHACRNLPGAIAARHLRRAGVPYVITPHGTAPRLERFHTAKRLFDATLGRSVMRQAAAVVAVTRSEARQLRGLGVPDAAIRVIPNPVDLDEWSTGGRKGAFRRRFALGDARVVLFLGKLTPRKRVPDLVDAMADLDVPGACLVVAGNDMGAGPDIRARVAARGLASRVLFTGLLRGPDRLDALRDADVVVYPSADEIFGLVPVEALLCGTPVVVAGDSGCAEVVADTGGGVVVPLGDTTSLTRAIDEVLRAPGRWRLEADEAARRVRTRFAAETIAVSTIDLYQSLASPAAARSSPGVSFVIPVRNGAPWLADVVASILAQRDGRPFEVIAIDDDSEDGSFELLERLAAGAPMTVLRGDGRGAAAAINRGLREARYPLIAQVDQDVVLEPGWMARLSRALDDPAVAASQGYYTMPAGARLLSRITALDLELRYAGIPGRDTDHVCTGNTIYRASALDQIGLFDESLGYGYDNDVSYRLQAAGHRLVLTRNARSRHHWRETLPGYCRQQYGYGYGRLELVSKHPDRAGGDRVSPTSMMLHPAVMSVAVALLGLAAGLAGVDARWEPAAVAGLALIGLLGAERLIAGLRAAVRFRSPTPLVFPAVHMVRDAAWLAACAMWGWRRLMRRPGRPHDSMHARRARRRACRPVPVRALCLIPAHNEAASLPGLIGEMRRTHADLALLVIDDGSTDGTADVLERLDVRWLRLPERLGIGSAMRAGLRLATRLGCDTAIRMAADGQHGPADIERLLQPLRERRADVVMGSRYASAAAYPPGRGRWARQLLGAWLSTLTGRRVTDPTSGFCALGPRAVRLLADHHPTGYPEPELQLFASRNGLDVIEVPVSARPRRGGQARLTPFRLAGAGARFMLAMVVVPLRRSVVRQDD